MTTAIGGAATWGTDRSRARRARALLSGHHPARTKPALDSRADGNGAPSAAGPTAPAAPDGHFPCFDGLRALAALSIVLTHVAFASGANSPNILGVFFARMDGGVAVFFVLSGFLLYRPFVARPPPRPARARPPARSSGAGSCASTPRTGWC